MQWREGERSGKKQRRNGSLALQSAMMDHLRGALPPATLRGGVWLWLYDCGGLVVVCSLMWFGGTLALVVFVVVVVVLFSVSWCCRVVVCDGVVMVGCVCVF